MDRRRSRTPITVWLTNGLPPTEAARRAGNGVNVILRVYAGSYQHVYAEVDEAIADAFATDG